MGKKGKKKSSNPSEEEGKTINGLIENSTTLPLKEASIMSHHDTNGVIEIRVDHDDVNDISPKEVTTKKLEEETSPSPKLVKESKLPNINGLSHELSHLELERVPVVDSNAVLEGDDQKKKISEQKGVQESSEQSEDGMVRCTTSPSPSSKLPVEIPIIVEGTSTSTSASIFEPSTALKGRIATSSGNIDEEYGIRYISYQCELQMSGIMKLIQKDLSEPYSVYTYRYFIHNWPKLCFLAMDEDQMVGVIVCKLDLHKQLSRRGYIAMLAVDERYRRRKIGSNLVTKSIHAMVEEDADEIVLETEITNKSALRLYENLGFVRDKRLFRYYLNGVDALRLKLWLR